MAVLTEGVFIFEVADTLAAKGRIIGLYSSEAAAERAASSFYQELKQQIPALSWRQWAPGIMWAEVISFPLAQTFRNAVFRITYYQVDKALAEADAQAITIPSVYRESTPR